MPGCPDSDELVTFEDLLEGRAGHVEQQAASQFQCLRDAGQASQHVEAPGRVFADETGPDLRIGGNSGGLMLLLVSLTLQHLAALHTLLPTGDRAGKRKRAVYATTDPYADPAGELWDRVTFALAPAVHRAHTRPIYVAGLDNIPARINT